MSAGRPVALRRTGADGWDVEQDGTPVGRLRCTVTAPGVATLTCWVQPADRRRGIGAEAVRLAAAEAFGHLGLRRLESDVRADDAAAQATATASGFRREGLARAAALGPDGRAVDVWRTALLADDPVDPAERRWGAVRAALRPALVAAGLLVRDGGGRALLVEPTYKPTWEVVGGLVDPGEGLLAAARRECQEEVGGVLDVGPLLAVDAVTGGGTALLAFLFDGGVHAPDLVRRLRFTDGELASAAWVDAAGARARGGRWLGTRVAAVLEAFASGRLPGPVLTMTNGVPET